MIYENLLEKISKIFFFLDHEDKHIWKVFLEKGDFEMALKYCQNDDLKKDQVWTKQASDLFDQEKYVESAQIYA